MDRKGFLKNLGIVGLSSTLLPLAGMAKTAHLLDEPTNEELLGKTTACAASPGETAGPYPLPSSVSTSSLVRTDITEGTQTGIPLTLTLTLLNVDNSCNPVSGLRVDIWHCNKRGYYSAYDGQPGIDGTQNTSGTTWLRGIQYSNSSGQVTFTSIYPGWYTPRATHIHVEVFNGSTLLLTTQLCFPDAINSTVNTYYATSGTNSVTNTTDMVFSDSYANELLTVTGSTSAGYTATGSIYVNAGSLGISDIAAETGGQFSGLSCYPNPITDGATISFQLLQQADVTLKITDISGRTVKEERIMNMDKGDKSIPISLGNGIASGSYFYQLEVANPKGTFRQTKQLIKL